VLAQNVTTVAYSYIGPKLTYPVYREGTIGKAKEDLEATTSAIEQALKDLQAKAFVSVNKALVTQASSAIPVVPLYISLLYKLMKAKGNHEGCIEQMYRLFADRLYAGTHIPVDEQNRIRIDDWELEEDTNLFGFNLDGVDYEVDVNPEVLISSIKE
jgi:enoyl-[acyl-carrier protein] reductase / trans-2-enoyl-CoA reductase (NAD+)